MHRYEEWNMDCVASDDGMPEPTVDDSFKPGTYHYPEAGEWVQCSLHPYRNFDACCDCGLVHEEEYKIAPCTDDPTELTLWRRLWRREEQTASVRSERSVKGEVPVITSKKLDGWEWAVVYIPVKKIEPPNKKGNNHVRTSR